VQRLRLPREAELTPTHSPQFDGIVQLVAPAEAVDEASFHDLYRTAPPASQPATLTALPYYLWANRGQGSMMVWIPET
jgi:DUF1680 family protein